MDPAEAHIASAGFAPLPPPTSSTSTLTKPTTTPLAKPTPTPLAKPTPTPLGRPQTNEYIAKLNHLCQVHGLSATYACPSVGPMVFAAELVLNDMAIREDGPFASKKAAKEAVAARGYEVVERRISETGRGGAGGSGSEEGGEAGKGKGGNWTGLLIEYCNTTASPGPSFQEFALATRFSCELTLASRASAPFGSRETLFPSKKAARAAAAREAVLWLQGEGMVDETFKAPRKGKGGSAPVAVAVAVAGKGDQAYARRAIELCEMLAMEPPQYRFEGSATNPEFVSGGAVFVDGAQMDNAQFEVRNVFGRKKAKEECARLVVKVLEEKCKRQETVRRVQEAREKMKIKEEPAGVV